MGSRSLDVLIGEFIVKKRSERPYSADRLMRSLASALARDFRDNIKVKNQAVNIVHCVEHENVGSIRGIEWDLGSCTDPYAFKCTYQMASLFKRYRFEKDLLSSSQLEEAAEKQFLDNQERLEHQDLSSLPSYMQWILFRARGNCHQILGNYDLEEHFALSRFGKKASVGIPHRKACEAERWECPISGSVDHISWFKDVVLSEDVGALNYVCSQAERKDAPFSEVDTLALSFVPKTFKSLRSIMPNTTIGAFYSDGLGKVIAKRLKAAGYDIAVLQRIHGEYARLGSITGKLVTADQSLASDNITLALVKAIVPSSWFEALNLGRIDQVKLPSGRVVKTPTFCTMGIGFTFPLQTLIFLCLLKAVNDAYSCGRSVVSVYGDDLVYGVELHPFVTRVFGHLSLKINEDKTFASGSFRESCGADYFAGVDVRPFQPRNERGSFMDRKAYEQFLYVLINGLRRRWWDVEVPLALDLLLTEASDVSRGILRVPQDFPDTAGVKCQSPFDMLGLTYQLSPMKFGKHGQVYFKYSRFIPAVMKETRHAPYLWRKLGDARSVDRFHDQHAAHPLAGSKPSHLLKRIEELAGLPERLPIFRYVAESERKGKSPGRRRARSVRDCPVIPVSGNAGRIVRQTGISVHWIPTSTHQP